MSVQVIFVMPAGCDSEEQCPNVMREAYNAAVINTIRTKWVKESDGYDAGTCKTDFVVFHAFEGDFYQTVLQSKSAILRPLVLLECITRATPIPRSDVPLVSLALEKCVVVATCVPKEVKRELRAKVHAMSGQFVLDLVSDATHLVTDGVRSEKFTIALKMGISIMRVEFIDALWAASQTKAVRWSQDEFAAYRCPVFLNLKVSATGFAKGDAQVRALVERHGGQFSTTMDVHRTDVLVCKSATATSSAKYKSAAKYNINCVTEAWVVDSVERGHALPNFEDYAVRAATSTPTKRGALVDPNFSQMSMIARPAAPGWEAMETQLVEQTADESVLLAGKRKGDAPDCAAIIDGMDVKRAKGLGLYLDGCAVFLGGFKQEQKEKLGKIVQFSGAFLSHTLNDRVTHAIVSDARCAELKQVAATNLPCAVVGVDWLMDSMTRQAPVDVDNYLLHGGASGESLASATSGTSSPLSKKGLSFLRANVTIMDVEPPVAPVAAQDDRDDDEDDVLKQYKRKSSLQAQSSVDDALAAFTMNPARPNRTAEEPSTNISITMEESVAAIFEGLKFAIVDYSQAEEEYLAEQIRDMHGAVVPKHYKGIPDYAVVPVAGGGAHVAASKVVTYIWVSDCVDAKRLIADLEYYHAPHARASDALAGLCVCFSGLAKSEKEFLAYVVAQHGGRQQDCMSRHAVEAKGTAATTHLVSSEAAGKKYVGALKWGIPVVGKEWLLRCAEEGRRVDECPFLVGESRERYKLSGSVVGTPSQSSKQIATPDRKRPPVKEDACRTPSNMLGPCSQVTPVNEIMARVRKMCGGLETPAGRAESPATPASSKSYMDMSTPESPYGAVFQNPPPPEMRKKWKRWLQKIASPPRTPSTPLSEIKRKFYARLDAKFNDPENETRIKKNFAELFPSCAAHDENVAPADEAMDAEDAACNDTESAMNDLMLGQLEQLESHMRSLPDASSARRQSARPVEHEGGAIPEKESQPMTVGWDEDMVVASPAARRVARHKHFMISGVDADARAALVDRLDGLGAFVSGLPNHDPTATHLLCEKLNRNEKLLASLASGLWVLHASYATDSAAAGRLLNEEDYEFGNPKVIHKFKLDADGTQRAAAARHWRQEIGQRGYGAFHDVRAIVLGQRRDPMVRVLQAGGAIIVDASPPFEGSINATHCFVDAKHVDLNALVPLAEQGIFCASALYVNDFLQRTGQTISDFIIPSFQKYY